MTCVADGARVQAVLEAADVTPLEKVRPGDIQKLIRVEVYTAVTMKKEVF
jgi:hypothetical protein